MSLIYRSRGSSVAVLGLALALSLFGNSSVAQAQCGGNTPAFPVPEFRGSTRLWPTNGFRPGNPAQQLPASRDTTQYLSTTFPSAASGHELYWALDVVGDRVFTMYNSGLQVWDVGGANAETPVRLHYRDGIEGHWFFHTPPGEADGYLTDIAAIQDPSNSNRILIAVSSLAPVGVTIWRFDRTSGALSQAYQNTSLEASDVEMINYGGTVYAFFATGTGAFVLNVSQTNNLTGGCLDNACPGGINLGKVGTAAGSRYLSVIERGGNLYMASSLGGLSPSAPPPEIWELNPALPSLAIRRFVGTVKDTHSPVFFSKSSTYYMAVVEARHVKIYNVNDCLDNSGCSALPAATFDHTLRTQNWSYNFLSYSVSEGTPFLYYGFEGIFPSGPAYERLFDLSNLGGSNVISEITSTGQTYTDACNGLGPIGYWADYYERNDHGYRNFAPRKGKFGGRYFYRANVATFDVHVRASVVTTPSITTTATSSAPYWFGEPINFSAAAQNCAGAENWTWFASDTNAVGLGANDSTATINWNICDGSSCPDKNIEVWALKDACAGATNLAQTRANITVSDPRPQIEALNVAPNSQIPDTYPLCTLLNLSAVVGGKSPFTYNWTVTNAAEQVIASSTSPSFNWDTSGVVITLPPDIFADGFESGDTSAWLGVREPDNQAAAQKAAAQKAAQVAAARAVVEEVTGAGSATFGVNVVVNNSTGAPDNIGRNITLTAIGDLAFVGATPITVTNLGGGQYRFQANTENATSWRWEFEDPANGTTVGCQFYTKCRVLNFGDDDSDVTNSWAQPNLDGTYRVSVTAANCLDIAPITAQISVPVVGIPTGSAPVVTSFSIIPMGVCSLSLNVMECLRNQPITFTVVHTGTATHYDFDWEGDGTFEQSLTVGSAITKTYTTTGVRNPKVRARNGGGTPSTAVGLPWTLEIID